jgi:membrane dipeptidase
VNDLHARALVLDAHMDTPSRMLVDDVDIARRTTGQADLVRWREGGIDVQVLAIWVDTIFVPHHAARRALRQIDGVHRVVEANPDRVGLARTVDDIARITGDGRLALMIAIEGGAAIQDDLALLRTFHRLGASSMTLTHSASTGWADASTDAPRWGGLNDFGRSVIREMNRLGMAVDVSHVSDDTLADVLETSEAPIIASHSSCRALCDHPRNLRDGQMRAIAATGGVIGINFFAGFVDQGYQDALMASRGDLLRQLNTPADCPPERLDAFAAERYRNFFGISLPRPPFERIVEHIDHAVSVVGSAHVGIGSDLDSGPIPTPVGMDGADDFPRITDALLARGYADDAIIAILGGNFLRVYGAIQGAAASAQATIG